MDRMTEVLSKQIVIRDTHPYRESRRRLAGVGR
jgi:hypothetical protein